jgi:FkbM family methyltransferase
MFHVFPVLAVLGSVIATHPLTRSNQFAAWARFAKWQIVSRLSRERTVPWLEGQRLVVRRGMTGATGNIYLGLHEFMSMMLILHFLRKEDLFFDVGANVGTNTVLASGVCGATTFAFEPDELTSRDLAGNVKINGLGDRVSIHVCALGDAEGDVLFTLGKGAMNCVTTVDDRYSHRVSQRTLDSMTAKRVPAMIKLDVEGYEEQVLRGATRTLADRTLKLISLEAATPSMLRLLGDNCFERGFYDPFTRVLQRTPNKLAYDGGRWTLSNEFFVRDWPFVEHRLATGRPVTVLGQVI